MITKNGKRVGIQRYIMEQHLGRPLQHYEKIHHIDGNPSNNIIDNLIIISRSEHSKITIEQQIKNGKHPANKHGEPDERICSICKHTFLVPAWRKKDKSRGKYCSLKCFRQSI